MPLVSDYPDVDVPDVDILCYLFAERLFSSHAPVWIDSCRPHRSVSAKQARQWVRRVGLGLQQLGLQSGDVVILCSPNHIMVPVAFLGIVGAGLIFSGVNPQSSVPELVHQLSDSTAKVILAHPTVLPAVLDATAQAGLPRHRIFQISDEAVPTRHGVDDWNVFLPSPEQADDWHRPVLDARWTIAAINYSSGTTGLPKGVCISHANFVANLEQNLFMHNVASSLPHPTQERWLGFLPLFHAYGQLFMILMALRVEASVFIMPEFNFIRLLDAVQTHRLTTLHIVPPVLVMLSKRSETSSYDLKCGRYFMRRSPPVPAFAARISNETRHTH